MKNHKIKIQALITLLIMIPTSVWARPVSYPGGWTVMQMNDDDSNTLHVHYSPKASYSIGYRVSKWRGESYQTHSFQINNLLKRWNNIDSQANFYLKSGIGLAYDTSGDQKNQTELHAFSGVSFDWENRRFYTKYENGYHYSGDFIKEFSEEIVVGVAPYIGEYGDLHTWLMLKTKHIPENDDHIVVTPFVRFFKSVHLFEIGVSEDKELLLNYIFRF